LNQFNISLKYGLFEPWIDYDRNVVANAYLFGTIAYGHGSGTFPCSDLSISEWKDSSFHSFLASRAISSAPASTLTPNKRFSVIVMASGAKQIRYVLFSLILFSKFWLWLVADLERQIFQSPSMFI